MGEWCCCLLTPSLCPGASALGGVWVAGLHLGSEQRFWASRLAAELMCPRPVCTHTQTRPPSFIHIHTHLSPKMHISSATENILTRNVLEEVPSPLASHWPCAHVGFW